MTTGTPKPAKATKRRSSPALLGVLFAGVVHHRGGGDACRMTFEGPARVSLSGIRWEDRQRMALRHFNRVRLKATDKVVAVCGNPKCLDKRHLYVIPAPLLPKMPKDA